MSLSDRVEELKRARTIVRLPRLPEKLLIEQSYDRVNEKYDQVSPINKVDYDALLTKLRAVARSRSIASLTIREMRLTASCLFDGEHHLADDQSFLDQFLDALRSIRSRAAIKRLIHSYFVHFDPNHRGIQRIAIFLRESIASIEGRWEWPERHRQFRIFDPAQAPEQLAGLTIKSINPRRELDKVGLSGQLSTSGLSAHVFLSALTSIQQRLENNPRLEDVDRAIAWVQADNGVVYFLAHRGALANTLLLPWRQRDPDQAIRDKIQGYLLDNLGDPRIELAPWVRTDDTAREVMIRWLARATLEQFLKVVDRVATKEQWNYRRAFWNAYIDKGAVGNAWVAFGSDGAQVARRIADDTADKLMRRFATLGGAGSDQAVLLLSIGDLVIADWSHNGRLRIWRRGNPSAPEFNMKSYLATELRVASDFDTVHRPPNG